MKNKILGLLIIFIVLLFLYIKFGEILLTKPASTQKIDTNITVIKSDASNFYLIKHNNKYIAFDAGANIDTIKLDLKKVNIDEKNIDYVFLTHTDFDHIAGLKIFNNAEIFIGKDEEQMINKKTKRFKNKYNELPYKYNLLEDGEILVIDDISIQCIFSSGHTMGSVSFLVDDKDLFVGDNLSVINGKIGLFTKIFNMDDELQKQSIEKLKNLNGIERLFTGHHGFYTNANNLFKTFP